MREEDYISELSKCVQCGSCKAYCPTYDEGLTEAMGARGRLTLLRGLLSGRIAPSPLLGEKIFSCILCGACEKLCTPGLNITEAIYHGRRLLRHHDPLIKYLAPIMRLALDRPMLSFRVARTLQHLGLSPLRIFDLSPLPHAPLRDDRQVYRPEKKKKGRVALFTGCSVNYIFPHLGVSLINVLLHLGYEVVLPKGEVCCGAPFRGLGMEEKAIEAAKRNVSAFDKLNSEAVLSLCPTCVLSIKVHYPRLIGRGLDNITDVSSFLFDKLGSIHPFPPDHFKRVVYHDPCHLNYSLGVREQPRELIKFAGAELLDSGEEGCCGFGGIFSLRCKDMSRTILKKKAGSYSASDAEAVVTACPGCILQLGRGVKSKPVLHVVELVEEAVCSPSASPVILNKGG